MSKRNDATPREWGFGNGAGGEGWKPFERVTVEGAECELAFGEAPHTRRDGNIYCRRVGDTGEPQGFNGNRHPWRVEVQEGSYWKESELSGDEVRATCSGKLYMGEHLVGVVSGREAQAVMLRLLALMPKAAEHPIALHDAKARAGIVGRKVYWRGEPGTVRMFIEDLLEVVIDANTESGTFRRMPWHDRDDERTEAKDSVYSESIWWFRDEGSK